MKKISDFKLEQFILNELPLYEKEEIEKYIQEDILLAQKVTQMKEENNYFLEKHPLSSLKLKPKKSPFQNFFQKKYFFPLFAFAAFLLILPFILHKKFMKKEFALKVKIL